jgi:hypothetical protein
MQKIIIHNVLVFKKNDKFFAKNLPPIAENYDHNIGPRSEKCTEIGFARTDGVDAWSKI